MKRLLLLAFYFWPVNNVAAKRPGSYAKYLPENGWLPTVICEDWPEHKPDYDPSLLSQLPKEVRVHRLLQPAAHGLYQGLFVRRLFRYVWPHRSPILWWQRARTTMLSILEGERFDAVWATSPPLTPLALAEEASAKYQLPWVMDVRDSYSLKRMVSWHKRPFFGFQERRLARKADRVIVVSEAWAEGLASLTQREVQVIHNGFDPQPFESVVQEPAGVFRIVFAGGTVREMNPAPFFVAVDRCIRNGTIPRSQLEVLFYGTDSKQLREAAGMDLDSLPVRILPRVPHTEVVGIMKGSAVLLVFTVPNNPGTLAVKLYDYLAAGRPILAVPDDRTGVSLKIRQCNAGVSATTVDAIARQLEEWYVAWTQNPSFELPRRMDEVAKYSRREQTKRLAQTLDQMISEPR